ncbi:MAG TPA: twin-arginine translocase subunit TatC [Pilimelia sp.]|nr:twin-arginine translocase subunit TatC [Pilimelia sp.]
MAFALRRRGPSAFERAADGSMTLVEHLRELRNRLFWASIGLLVGFVVGFVFAERVFDLLAQPYCNLPQIRQANGKCAGFLQLNPADGFIIKLKIALWLGIVVGAPVWLYQLWAFVAPGLHRHERKWAYVFTGIAVPLFAGGVALAYFVVDKGLAFLLDAGVTNPDRLEVTGYISFVTTMLLLFGAGFEFPLLLLMLNFTGVASAKRMLGWWRPVVFLCFAFAAIATPDPGPFGMTLLALSLCLLYFLALGVAFLNDRRRARRDARYADLDDDEASPLDYRPDEISAGDPVELPAPVPAPLPLDRRFDEDTT